MTDRTPITIEARGRLSVWKAHALRRERVVEVFNSDEFGKIGTDFRQKGSKCQRRALDKLNAMLAEARFIRARTDSPPHVLWAILHPRGAVTLDGPGVAPGML